MRKIYTIGFIAFFTASIAFNQSNEVSIAPLKDNSIYEEDDLSNGAGEHLFTGVIKTGERRRALLAFDLNGVLPEGTTIDSAKLMLQPTKLKSNGDPMHLHLLLKDWGEGTSEASGPEGKGIAATAGDVVWTKTMFEGGESWETPGGDFEASASASSSASLATKTVFSSAQMTSDINNWLANPAENFGWIILGDESKSSTAIRFSSRENSSEEQQPLLTLYFEGPVAVADRLNKDSEWLIFQNGPQGQLSLRGESAGKEMLFELYSLTGAKVYTEMLPAGSAQIAVYTGLQQEGIYIYRLQSGNTAQSGKIRISSY